MCGGSPEFQSRLGLPRDPGSHEKSERDVSFWEKLSTFGKTFGFREITFDFR